MIVAMDPELWLVLLDDGAEVRNESRRQGVAEVPFLDRLRMGRMVGHHDGRSLMRLSEFGADESEIEQMFGQACRGMKRP